MIALPPSCWTSDEIIDVAERELRHLADDAVAGDSIAPDCGFS
jgi:hypothetical protein